MYMIDYNALKKYYELGLYPRGNLGLTPMLLYRIIQYEKMQKLINEDYLYYNYREKQGLRYYYNQLKIEKGIPLWQLKSNQTKNLQKNRERGRSKENIKNKRVYFKHREYRARENPWTIPGSFLRITDEEREQLRKNWSSRLNSLIF